MKDSSPIAPDEVVDLLDRLVAKSLITFDAGTARYRCLETVRQYAREQYLTALDAGEEDRRQKHATFFHDLLESLKELSGPESFPVIEADYENMRQAIDWWSMQPKGYEALDMVGAMYRYWFARGLLKEGLQRAGSALEERKSNKDVAYGNALYTYADLTMHLGNFGEAKSGFEEMLSIGKREGNLDLQIYALSGLAGIHQDHLVDYHLSREYRLQCLELTDQLPGREMHKVHDYYNLGDLMVKNHPDLHTAQRREILEEARSYFEQAHQISQGHKESQVTHFLMAGLANVDLQLGDIASAKAQALDGFRLSLKSGYTICLAVNLTVLSHCALASGSPDAAAILMSASLQITERIGFVQGVQERAQTEKLVETCVQQLGQQKYQELAERARSMSNAELLDLADREIKV